MNVRLLKYNTVRSLWDAISENLDLYREGDFGWLDADASQYIETGFKLDAKALSGLTVSGDDSEVQSAIAMGHAFPCLTPYLASDPRLWVYVTHVLCLPYARARWPIPQENDEGVAVRHVQRHFFGQGRRGIERDNAASRLWWHYHLCERVDRLDVRSSLRAFLYKSDVRANIVEHPTVCQNRSVFNAIIERLHESLVGGQTLFERKVFRELMKEINLAGGDLLLETLTPEQIALRMEEWIERARST